MFFISLDYLFIFYLSNTVGCLYNESNIHLSAVITRSDTVRYCINNCGNWGRISIRCWINKIHPIPRPNGRAMVCLLLILLRKLTALKRHRTVPWFCTQHCCSWGRNWTKSLYSQKTPHSSPMRASYGLSCETTDYFVTALHRPDAVSIRTWRAIWTWAWTHSGGVER